jgi:hypothetical protein
MSPKAKASTAGVSAEPIVRVWGADKLLRSDTEARRNPVLVAMLAQMRGTRDQPAAKR